MTLQGEVRAYLDRTGMPRSRLGRAALGDPGAIGKLMEGLPFGERRGDRLRDFMRRYPDGVGARHSDPEAYRLPNDGSDMRRTVQPTIMEPGEMCAPASSISQIAANDASLARSLTEEANRLNMPIAAFLADMVALGFRCHVEDLRESTL